MKWEATVWMFEQFLKEKVAKKKSTEDPHDELFTYHFLCGSEVFHSELKKP
jgi:hypothetical protein